MSSLEQEASARKAKLSQLRAKRNALESNNSSEESKNENGNKKPKLVQRNFVKTDEEESAITKLIIDNDDTAETVAKSIENEILLRYSKMSKLDWSEIGDAGEEKKKKKQSDVGVFDEYREKLKLQELELLKLTNEKILMLRKEIGAADKGK